MTKKRGSLLCSTRVFRSAWIPATAALAIACILAGCSKQEAAPPPRPSIPVVVAKVTQKTVPLTMSAIGNVEAYSTVSIRAQVAGELLEVHFMDGDFVTKGQLLFTIDSRPYEASLAQAQAALARDKVQAANNRVQAERYKKLLDQGVVPASQVESFTSTADSSDAVVKSDEAAIQTAELNVSYCKIYSPIAGRAGTALVKAGNLVKESDVPMVVINQINPVYVNFTVPQETLGDVKKYMALRSLPVQATIPNDQDGPENGTLTFIDNLVDASTGTIHLKGTFANTQNRLWPGLFVNTVMKLSEEPNVVVVPTQAITTGQQNKLMVYVVKADNTVEARTVTSTRAIAGDSIVSSGLAAGETVVTDGQMRLTPGAKVQIKNADPVDPPGKTTDASEAISRDAVQGEK